jgi:hypothetical protein
MGTLVFLAMVIGPEESYVPTQIGLGLWKSPAGFVYRSDKFITGDELRRQEAAAGLDVGWVPERKQAEISHAYYGFETAKSPAPVAVSFLERPRANQQDTYADLELDLQRAWKEQAIFRTERKDLAVDPEPVVRRPALANVPGRQKHSDAEPLSVDHAESAATESRLGRSVSIQSIGLPNVVLGSIAAVCLCSLIALLIAQQCQRQEMLCHAEDISPKPESHSRTTPQHVLPRSRRGNLAAAVACPYCHREPIHVEPTWRYFRCPQCNGIVSLGQHFTAG